MSLNYTRNYAGEIVQLENSTIKLGDLVIENRERLAIVKSIHPATDRWGVKYIPEYPSYVLVDPKDITKYLCEVPYWLVQKVEEYK